MHLKHAELRWKIRLLQHQIHIVRLQMSKMLNGAQESKKSKEHERIEVKYVQLSRTCLHINVAYDKKNRISSSC